MKFTITSIITFFITLCYSQQKFEKGTIMFTNNSSIECLIKHSYSSENPTSVKYKLTEDSEEKTALLREIEGFQIGDKAKYIKATVNFDTSSNKIEELSSSKLPEYIEETALLEVLVEGSASLYRLEKNNIIKFFYKIEEGEIKPLVYKKYKVNNLTLRENFEYIQQLNNEVNCDKDYFVSNKAVGYNSNDLAKFFKKFNNCKDNILTFEELEERVIFKFYAKASFHLTNNQAKFAGSYNQIDQAAKGSGLDAGILLELNLPYQYRKWSIIGELTYYSVNNEFSITNPQGYKSTAISDINTIRTTVGIRHNFYLNSDDSENNIIFLEALVTMFNFQIGENSITRISQFSSTANDVKRYEINTLPNIAISGGFPIYKNLSGSIRYNMPQQYLTKYLSHSYKVSSFSVSLNYRFL